MAYEKHSFLCMVTVHEKRERERYKSKKGANGAIEMRQEKTEKKIRSLALLCVPGWAPCSEVLVARSQTIFFKTDGIKAPSKSSRARADVSV